MLKQRKKANKEENKSQILLASWFTSLCNSKVVSISDVPSMLLISSCSLGDTFCSTSFHSDSGGVYAQGSPAENAIMALLGAMSERNHSIYIIVVHPCTYCTYCFPPGRRGILTLQIT